MGQQWVIVTGGNRGIGYDLCRKLMKSGRSVLLCSRDKQAGLDAASKLATDARSPSRCVSVALDVADPESVQSFISHIGAEYSGEVHALVNNAGVYPSGWTREIFDNTLTINFRSPMELAIGLAPHIAEGGRIVNVTSGLGATSNLSQAYRDRVTGADSIDELRKISFDSKDDFGFKPTYCLSKAMINRATTILTRHPDFQHLSVNAADPGWCRTDMGGSGAPRSLDQGSESILTVLNLPVDVRGGVFTDGKQWRQSQL